MEAPVPTAESLLLAVLDLPLLHKCLDACGVWTVTDPAHFAGIAADGLRGTREILLLRGSPLTNLGVSEGILPAKDDHSSSIVSCMVSCSGLQDNSLHGEEADGLLVVVLMRDGGPVAEVAVSHALEPAAFPIHILLDRNHEEFKTLILQQQQQGDRLSLAFRTPSLSTHPNSARDPSHVKVGDLSIMVARSDEAAAWLKCRSQAHKWMTAAPWQVSRAWRDAFFLDPAHYVDVMAAQLLARHASCCTAVRRALRSRSHVLNPQALAHRVFQLAAPLGIQEARMCTSQTVHGRDDDRHPLPTLDPLWIPTLAASAVVGGRVYCTWEAQGWGDARARLYLALVREGKPVPSSFLALFGNAKHEQWTWMACLGPHHAGFKRCILDQQQGGDWLSVWYSVGGEGVGAAGHSLHVSSLRVVLAHSEQAVANL